MANSKAEQPFVKIGRRTGKNVIPAKNVIGRATDGTEKFEDYWTDPDSDSDTSTESLMQIESSRIEAQNRLGRRTGVKALSGKKIRPKEDGTEDFNDYWTDRESETDASCVTRPSSLTDASRRTRPSSINASNLTRKSSLRRSIANLNVQRDSCESEKTVLDKSCNTSRSFKDRLAFTTHASTNTATESRHLSESIVSSNRGDDLSDSRHSSSRENSPKAIFGRSRSTQNKKNPIVEVSVRDNYFDDAKENKSAPGTPMNLIARPPKSTKSKHTPGEAMQEDESYNAEEMASKSMLGKNESRQLYSLRSSPRKSSQTYTSSPLKSHQNSKRHITENPDVEENSDSNNENEIASASISYKNTTYSHKHFSSKLSPKKVNSPTHSLLASPLKNSLRDPSIPSKNKSVTFDNSVHEEYNDREENETTSSRIKNAASTVKETTFIHSLRSSPRKSLQKNAPSSSKAKKSSRIHISENSDSEVEFNEGEANKITSFRNEKSTDRPPNVSSEMSPNEENGIAYSLRSSPRKSSQDNSFKTSKPTRGKKSLNWDDSRNENNKAIKEIEVTSTKTSPSKENRIITSLRSSPTKNSQRNTPTLSKTRKTTKNLISDNSASETEFDNNEVNKITSTSIRNENATRHASRERSSSKNSSTVHLIRSSNEQSSQNNIMISTKSKMSPVYENSANEEESDIEMQERASTSSRSVTAANKSRLNSKDRPGTSSEPKNKVNSTSKRLKNGPRRTSNEISLNAETNFDSEHHSSPAKSSQEKILRTFRHSKEPVREVESENMTDRKMASRSRNETVTKSSREIPKQRKIITKVFTKCKNKMLIESLSDKEIDNEVENEIDSGNKSQVDKYGQNKVVSPKKQKRLQRQNHIVGSSSSDDEIDNDKRSQKASISKKMPFRPSTSNSRNKSTSLNKTSKKNKVPNTSGSSRNNNHEIEVVSTGVEEEATSNEVRGKTYNDNSKQISKKLSTRPTSFSKRKLVDYSRGDESYSSPEREITSFTTRKESVMDNQESGSDIDLGANSDMSEYGSVNLSSSQHLSPKKQSKAKKSTSTSSNNKSKFHVVENTENDPECVEQEFETYDSELEIDNPRNIESESLNDKSHNISKRKVTGLQASSTKKSRHLENDPSREEKSNSSKMKKSLTENAESDRENLEHEIEAQDLEPEVNAPREKKSKKSSSKTKRSLVESDHENLEREVKAQDLGPEGNPPKGKKSKINRKRAEIPSDNLRRSNRERLAPLKLWANERRRFIYNSRTGEIKNLGVIPGTGVDDSSQKSIINRELQKYEKRNLATKKKGKKAHKKLPTTTVYNRKKGREEKVNLHMLFEYNRWEVPLGKTDDDANYFVARPFNSKTLNFGYLKLRPMEIKPSQFSPASGIQFVVIKGKVKAIIRNTELKFKTMDMFLIPKDQPYSIENLSNFTAVISFCSYSVPFFDYEMEDSDT